MKLLPVAAALACSVCLPPAQVAAAPLPGAPRLTVSGQDPATGLMPVVIAQTEGMDEDVLALIQEKVAAAIAAPSDVEAHIELGLAYEANTYWLQAEQCYRIVLRMIPQEDITTQRKRTEWLFRLAVVQYKNGDLLNAIENMRAAATVFKNTAVVQARLAHMLFQIGEIDESIDAWNWAIESEAVSGQGPWAPSRWGLAMVMIQQEKFEEAIELLSQAIAINPSFRAAHYQMGIALSELGRDDEAELAFARGVNAYVEYPPDPHQVRLGALERGFNRRMMNIENMVVGGQAQAALAELEQMRTKRPGDQRVLNLMAKVYSSSGNMPKALETYAESEALKPDDYIAKIESAYVLLNMQRFDESLAKAQEAVRLAPRIGRNYYYLGLAQNFSGSAMMQNPDPQVQQEGQQRKQAALGSLQAAMGHGCTEPQLFQYMAQLYAEMGRTSEMVKYGEQFARTHGSNPAAHLFLAQVYWTRYQTSQSADDAARARKATERAMAIGPNDPQVKAVAPQLIAAIEAAAQGPKQGPPVPDKQ